MKYEGGKGKFWKLVTIEYSIFYGKKENATVEQKNVQVFGYKLF